MDWLKRALGATRRDSQPPPPDTSAPPSPTSEELVDVVYSRSRKYREVITQDAAGRFRVHDERWSVEDWDVAGAAYWCPYDRTATITDTIENARKLAAEALSGVEPHEPQDEDVER